MRNATARIPTRDEGSIRNLEVLLFCTSAE
jgi:hypothetical protein